jgi:von Willebrand factor type A C-terminal domain
VTAADVGQEILAARVSLVASLPDGQRMLGQGLVRATWTEDEELSTTINPQVVVDGVSGTVRVKKKVEAADEMALDAKSTKTVRLTKD